VPISTWLDSTSSFAPELLYSGTLWLGQLDSSSSLSNSVASNIAGASTSTLPTLIIYSLIIVAMALLGGWIPQVVRLTHNWMQILISFEGLKVPIGLLSL
jgi:hypothetical protein